MLLSCKAKMLVRLMCQYGIQAIASIPQHCPYGWTCHRRQYGANAKPGQSTQLSRLACQNRTICQLHASGRCGKVNWWQKALDILQLNQLSKGRFGAQPGGAGMGDACNGLNKVCDCGGDMKAWTSRNCQRSEGDEQQSCRRRAYALQTDNACVFSGYAVNNSGRDRMRDPIMKGVDI